MKRRAFLGTLAILLCGACTNLMDFKFITAGQHPDDALVHSQVIRGRSLLPLPPANVQGYTSVKRDYYTPAWTTGNIGISWTRRSRLGAGLRPNSDVPIGEEIVRYEVEIMNGADVERTLVVFPDQPEAVLWRNIHSGNAILDWDESIIDTSPFPAPPSLYISLQTFHADSEDFDFAFWANTTTGTDYRIPRYIGIIPVTSLNNDAFGTWIPTVGFQRLQGTFAPTTLGLSAEATLTSSTRSQLVLKVVRGVATLYQDPQGNYGAPLGTEGIPVSGDYKIVMLQKGIAGDPFMINSPICARSNSPSTVYFYKDAEADFGTVPSTLTVRVYQVSSVVGRGPYKQATFPLN